MLLFENFALVCELKFVYENIHLVKILNEEHKLKTNLNVKFKDDG